MNKKEKIIRFRRQGLGYADIGRELDISKDTVKSFCRRNGLMISDCNPVDDKDRCRECGKPIVQQEKNEKTDILLQIMPREMVDGTRRQSLRGRYDERKNCRFERF